MYGVTLANVWNFLLKFLHKPEIWLLKVSLLSNLNSKRFLTAFIFYIKIFYSCINSVVSDDYKWYLSALLFVRLSLNHLNSIVEASSTDLTIPVYNQFIITVPIRKVVLESEHKFLLILLHSNTTSIDQDIK